MIVEKKELFSPNAKQKEAIDCIEGSVMLLAGPGTGKTFTLVKRVEKMLCSGIDPKSILCLTFSDAAALEMSKRLIQNIGLEACGVNVSTYHGFCNELIRQNPLEFELTETYQMADEVTKQAVLKECIDEYPNITGNEIEFLKDKWGNKYFYISSILSGINTIKRERTTKEEFFNYLENNENWIPELNKLILERKERIEKKKPLITCEKNIAAKEREIGKAKEFYTIYKIYEKKLAENNLIDFSDMINLVLEKMENDEKFLYDAVKNYKYLLVDEYQDTSKVQNQLIFNILKGANTNNIFVVGDDDQIIYSFQGAKCTNLTDFLEKFRETKIISLEENRRSTQTILDIASNLIEKDTQRLTNNPNFKIEKKLIAKNEKIIKKEQKAEFSVYQETIQENNSIIEKVKSLIESGVEPKEIAVIARKNEYLENLERLFKQNNIPSKLSKQKNAFDIPSFIVAYFYFKLLVNSYIEQDKIFALLGCEPFNIKDIELAKFLSISRKTNEEYIKILQSDEFKNSKQISSFLETFAELKKKKSYTPLMPFIYETLSKTGILHFYSNNNEKNFENIEALNRLIDEAKSYSVLHRGAVLEGFLHHLDTYFNQGIKLELKKDELSSDSVRLLTYHSSKGLEFEHVFMPNLTARALENLKSSSKELKLPIEKSLFSDEPEINKDAEIVRLLFVGMTRAKYGLHLSYSNANEGNSQSASKYISGLFPKSENLFKNEIFSFDKEIKTKEITKNLNVLPDCGEYIFELKERTKNLIISPTALNKYLQCPLNYFYSEILKVPVFIEDKDILQYGSSIHTSIDFMTKDAIKNGFWQKKEKMLEIFTEKMNSLEFSSKEKREELILRGKKAIDENYAALAEFPPENIADAEYRLQIEYKGVTLKGFADRVIKNSEGDISIIDFKTGTYKNVNKDEEYYNQLRFYKFLYETQNGKPLESAALIFFEEGMKLSFIEKDLTQNNEIKEKIDFMLDGIKSLNFEPKKSVNACKYCNYKLICALSMKA